MKIYFLKIKKIIESNEEEEGNLVDTVVSVFLGESEVKNVMVKSGARVEDSINVCDGDAVVIVLVVVVEDVMVDDGK